VSATAPVRPTGDDAYRTGTGAFVPRERRIVPGATLTRRHAVTADVCVIGSGAGGGPVAKELAEGGMDVVILEEGEWWDADAFTARPREMVPRLYRDAGHTVTLGNPPLLLPLGSAIGGTTLINSGTCFRTPAPVLERWGREYGLDQLTPVELDPFVRRVERIINVSRVPADLAGANAEVIRRGAERLGWSSGYLYRNVRGCIGSGVCAYGCPSGAKQHAGIAYAARAWEAGATTFTGARATGLELRGGRVGAVIARTAGGGRLRVRCERVIVACGTLYTPPLLHRFGVRSRELGRNLSIHPATAVRARLDEEVHMWDGVPQSYYVDEFADEGVMLEGIAGPPDYLAVSTPRRGAEHRELMLDARRTATFGVMVSDTSRGRVYGTGGRPVVRYDINDEDARRFKRGLLALAEIYWAAGAREVIVPVSGVPTLRDGDSTPLERHPVPPASLKAMAFHPLGTARAGADPARSVVGPDFAVRGIGGLHVCDGSVVPSSLGVNPQITIMTLATRLAFALLGRPAPTDEPHPEHIA
jgi:choline dehydrogenase-like flavoprotein